MVLLFFSPGCVYGFDDTVGVFGAKLAGCVVDLFFPSFKRHSPFEERTQLVHPGIKISVSINNQACPDRRLLVYRSLDRTDLAYFKKT